MFAYTPAVQAQSSAPAPEKVEALYREGVSLVESGRLEAAFTGRVVYIGYAKEFVSYETRLFVQKN